MPVSAATRVKDKSNIPIAPGKLPIIGHAHKWRKNPVDFISSLRADGRDLVKIYMGPVPVYFVLDPGLAYEMQVGHADSFEKGRLFDKLRNAIGNGLINSNGAFHRRQRRLMQPLFHRRMLDIYAGVMKVKAEEMVACWAPGEIIDIQQAVDKLSLEIAVNTLFSTELGARGRDAVIDCLPVLLRSVIKRTVLPEFLFALPTPGGRRLKQAHQTMRDAVQTVIDAYREDGADHGDLMAVLIAARDDETGTGMTDQQLHDEVLTLMLAAAEGTSAALSSIFFRLSQNPDVEAKVCAEIEDILGGRTIECEDITKFTYLPNVVNEVLRLDPPTDVVMRRTTQDLVFGGVHFPSGTELAFSAPALHRDPAVYENPLEFDPDRWDRAPARSLPRGSYLPFGVGVRQCIGNSYALIELTVIATTVLSKWKLTVAPGAQPEQFHRPTPHFQDLLMTVEPR